MWSAQAWETLGNCHVYCCDGASTRVTHYVHIHEVLISSNTPDLTEDVRVCNSLVCFCFHSLKYTTMEFLYDQKFSIGGGSALTGKFAIKCDQDGA